MTLQTERFDHGTTPALLLAEKGVTSFDEHLRRNRLTIWCSTTELQPRIGGADGIRTHVL